MKQSLQLTKPVGTECPVCQSRDVNCLTSVSANAHVDYFRCEACCHVWSLPRPVSNPPCDYPDAPRR